MSTAPGSGIGSTLSDIDPFASHKKLILNAATMTLTSGEFAFEHKFKTLMLRTHVDDIFAELNAPEYMGLKYRLSYEAKHTCRGCATDYGCACDRRLVDQISVTINKLR